MSNIAIEDRAGYIGASEVASLFNSDLLEAGEKAFASRLEMWGMKSGLLEPSFKGSERADWGIYLEDGIAKGCAERYGWTVHSVHRYFKHPAIERFGASPDFEIVAHGNLGPGLVELKNVDGAVYRKWPEVSGVDDPQFYEAAGLPYLETRREPPLRLQLQVQAQLACAPTKQWATLSMLVGGNHLVTIPYRRIPEMIAAIEAEVPMFWAEVDSGIPPSPDWEVDAKTVMALYNWAEKEKSIDLRHHAEIGYLAAEYAKLGARGKEIDGQRDVLKAQMLQIIGDAAKAYLPGGATVSAGMVKAGDVSYHRAAYRGFRVYPRKV
jgi:predicted phage-related endonuclease